VRHEADGFLCLLPVLERDERRNRLHAEPGGELGLLVDVDFADLEVGARRRHLIEDGREHAAGAAPGRPEVEQHGALGVRDLALEVFFCNLHGSHAFPSQSS
jgi:hypothetical protein